jgi:putative membrane protein
MKALIRVGKAITLCAWLLMLYNLLMPIGDTISQLLSLLLLLTVVMHCVQLLIFHRLFSPLLPLGKADYGAVLLFGVFSLLDYRQRVLANMVNPYG